MTGRYGRAFCSGPRGRGIQPGSEPRAFLARRVRRTTEAHGVTSNVSPSGGVTTLSPTACPGATPRRGTSREAPGFLLREPPWFSVLFVVKTGEPTTKRRRPGVALIMNRLTARGWVTPMDGRHVITGRGDGVLGRCAGTPPK